MIFRDFYDHPHKPGVRVCKRTLDRILGKNQSKSESIQDAKEPIAAKAQEPKSTPAISPTQQKAVDDLKKLKAGIPFGQSYTPQAETKIPEPPKMSFEEGLIANWKNDLSLQKEFTSFNSYAAYMRAEAKDKGKVIGGCVVR